MTEPAFARISFFRAMAVSSNSGLPASDNYIRMVLPFTSSLDKVSEKLFELKTNGGEEYCGAVIQRALQELAWKKYDDVYRVIFIAGNEPFTQGPVDFRPVMESARTQGIFVNTIFAGNRQEGIATQWLAGAQLAQGDFHVINQDRMVQVMTTPYDDEIQRLGGEYNSTVIPMGYVGKEEEDRMHTQDARIAAAAPTSGAGVERAAPVRQPERLSTAAARDRDQRPRPESGRPS